MRRATVIKPGVLLFVASVAPALAAQHAHDTHGVARHPAEMNKKFADPNLSVEEFVKRFESETRETFVRRDEIVRAVDLKPGQSVADVGAGTGLFTLLFAKQVGSKGNIYAVDISPAFLKHIEKKAKDLGQDRIVKTVKNTQESIELPRSSVDVVFICDTYHHFDHPRRMLTSIHRALKADGRLILVDFDLRPESSDAVKKRARAPRDVYFREIEAAGFVPIASPRAPKLKEQFFAEFRRTESPAAKH